jgi:hypothetical protein
MKTEQAASRARAAGVVAGAILLSGVVTLAAKSLSLGGSSGRSPVEGKPQIPVGTIIPVSLDRGLKAEDARKGELIELRVKQEVPLPHSGKIPVRSKLTGYITSTEKDTDGSGLNVSLRFDKLKLGDKTVPILTSLRAMASYQAVRWSQMPQGGSDPGTPTGWGNTVLIGGDIRFGDGGKVRTAAKQVVGKGVRGGVLVHIRANPEGGCEGPVNGDDHPQALWVFSSGACGLYDLKGVTIRQNGRSDPLGEITLGFDKENKKLESGTGMLLRVVPSQ